MDELISKFFIILVPAVFCGVASFSLGLYLVYHSRDCADVTLETCPVANYHGVTQTCIAMAGLSAMMFSLIGCYVSYYEGNRENTISHKG